MANLDTYIDTYNLAYSDKIYLPESILIGWLSLSSVLVTASLLFYHMVKSNSLKLHPVMAKFISISLILISTFYMYFSLGPYYNRIHFTELQCRKYRKCSKIQELVINRLKNLYSLLVMLTIFIQLLIVYFIVVTI
jgi:hypothetical protein